MGLNCARRGARRVHSVCKSVLIHSDCRRNWTHHETFTCWHLPAYCAAGRLLGFDYHYMLVLHATSTLHNSIRLGWDVEGAELTFVIYIIYAHNMLDRAFSWSPCCHGWGFDLVRLRFPWSHFSSVSRPVSLHRWQISGWSEWRMFAGADMLLAVKLMQL